MEKNIKKQGANLTLKIMLTSILPIILIGTMAYVAMNQVRDYVADSMVQKMLKISSHDLSMAFSGGSSTKAQENSDKEYSDEERGDVLGELQISMNEVKSATGAEYVLYYNASALINTFDSDISEVEGVGAISDDMLAQWQTGEEIYQTEKINGETYYTYLSRTSHNDGYDQYLPLIF